LVQVVRVSLMGGECGTNGGQEMHTVCQWQNLNVRDHVEDLGVNISTQVAIQKFKDQDISRTIILPVVLYGCETWSLTLREERKLRVFENKVLRGIFGPRRGEVTGEWRKLHNEELNDLYSSPSIVRVIKSRRMRWVGHVARMGEVMGVYRVLVGKPEERRPLGRPRRRWVGNIRMYLQEVECRYVDWIGLAQDRDRWRTVVSAVMNLRVP